MVPPEVSLYHVQAELQRAKPYVELFGLDVDTSMLSEKDLRIRVTGSSRTDEETYVVEMRFDGYRAIPTVCGVRASGDGRDRSPIRLPIVLPQPSLHLHALQPEDVQPAQRAP